MGNSVGLNQNRFQLVRQSQNTQIFRTVGQIRPRDLMVSSNVVAERLLARLSQQFPNPGWHRLFAVFYHSVKTFPFNLP